MKSKIAVITGTRSDYNYLRLILKKILSSNKLELSLLVTGMHLLNDFGNTIRLIEKDNIPISKTIKMFKDSDREELRIGKAVGRAIMLFTEAFNEIQPDLLLVLGDRYEILAAVIAASTLLIPIAHIHGGDNVFQGQTDEQIRHAITKFAHIHFPATSISAKRIKLLGEEEWRIFHVGSPSIDHIYHEEFFTKDQLCKTLGLNEDEKIVICLQHPYIIRPKKAGEQMRLTLDVLKELNLQTIIIYPNNDRGSDLIIKEIERDKEFHKFKIFKNLEYRHFYSLLKNSDLLIGNSSAGIIETPAFNLPVVNIGDRNKGRESTRNIINVPYDFEKIKKGVIKGLSEEFKINCQNLTNPYGDGKASQKIVKIIEKIKFDDSLLVKKLNYEI